MLKVINPATSTAHLSEKDFPDVAAAARKDRGSARCRRNVLEGWTICDAESSSDEEWLFCDEVEDLNHDTEDKPSYASIAKEHIDGTTAAVADSASSEDDETNCQTQENSHPKHQISPPAAGGPKVATQSQAAETKAEKPARSSRPPKQTRGPKKAALTGESDEEFIEWKEQRRLRRRNRRGGC